MTALAAGFDALLLDLDGTVYLGGQVIPHVTEALSAAAAMGARSVFVTNNASRSPQEVAAALTGMGVPAGPDDVLSSPQAAATLLASRHPAGSAVLVVGAPFLADSVSAAGLVPVREAAAAPVAVVQGHSPDTGWRDLAEACIALRAGADWVACNVDATLPTDRGLLPGNGSMVQALRTATGSTPVVAGKPNRPLLDEAVRRTGSRRPLVVGDRLDTDIEAGVTADMPSLLVLTGVSTAADLLIAPPAQRPTHLALDLRGLVVDGQAADLTAPQRSGWRAVAGEGGIALDRPEDSGPAGGDDLAGLAAVVVAAWRSGAAVVRPGDEAAAALVSTYRLPL